MADLDRRSFLALTAGLCAACALGGNVLAAPDTKAEPVDIGPLSGFKTDGVNDKFARNHFLVIRNDGKLYASSSLCTHKGVPLTVRGGEILCTKHGSKFSNEGTVTKGPARDSLVRYAISTNDKGHVIVDTGTSFREKNFGDKKAYVDVSK